MIKSSWIPASWMLFFGMCLGKQKVLDENNEVEKLVCDVLLRSDTLYWNLGV